MEGSDDTAYRQRVTVIVTAVLMALSTWVYCLRLVARSLSRAQLHAEDYLMGTGLFLSWGLAICIFISVKYGFGQHESSLSKDDLRRVLIVCYVPNPGRAQFTLQKMWAISMCFVKCSIITLYMRLFQTPTFRRVGWCLIVFSVCWALSGFLGNLLQCLPPSYFYDKSIPGHCMDPRAFFTAIGTVSFVEDVVILSMPMPMIWNLSIDLRRKIAVTAIFLLGAFVCVTSVLRLTTFKEVNATDVTYTNVWPGLWTYIELSVGSICGSLPLLRPVVGRVFRLTSFSSNYQDRRYGPSRSSRQYTSAKRDTFPLSRRHDPIDLSAPGHVGFRTQVRPNSVPSLHECDELELVCHTHITVHTEIRHHTESLEGLHDKRGNHRIQE